MAFPVGSATVAVQARWRRKRPPPLVLVEARIRSNGDVLVIEWETAGDVAVEVPTRPPTYFWRWEARLGDPAGDSVLVGVSRARGHPPAASVRREESDPDPSEPRSTAAEPAFAGTVVRLSVTADELFGWEPSTLCFAASTVWDRHPVLDRLSTDAVRLTGDGRPFFDRRLPAVFADLLPGEHWAYEECRSISWAAGVDEPYLDVADRIAAALRAAGFEVGPIDDWRDERGYGAAWVGRRIFFEGEPFGGVVSVAVVRRSADPDTVAHVRVTARPPASPKGHNALSS